MAAPAIQGSRVSSTFSGINPQQITMTGVTAGEAIVINARWYGTTTLNSAACSGETVEVLGSAQTGGPSDARSQWVVIRNVGTGGSKTIDLTFSAITGTGAAEGWRISGQDTTNTVNDRQGADGVNATPSVTLTTTVNECLGLCIGSNNGADFSSPASGWALITVADLFWFDSGMEAADLGASGSKTCSATASGSGDWVINAIAIAPLAGPTITDQPDDITRYSGQTASFTVAATGTGTITYQWERSTNNGGSWSNVSGGTGATSVTYTTAALGFVENGYLYRCVVTDDNGSTNSNGARLTLISAASLSWFRV